MKHVSFIIPYPLDKAPSQRFRFEFFIDRLREDYQISIFPFYSYRDYEKLKSGHYASYVMALLKGFMRRLVHTIKSRHSDIIFIHRETTPVGPPVFEFILSRIFRRRIIYDFDDAIWLPDPHEKGLRRLLKWKGKVSQICAMSWRISCGNKYLASYASRFCEDVRLIPTVIDATVHKPAAQPQANKIPVIGWTGSASTLVYLQSLFPLLEKLHRDHSFTLAVISDKEPENNLPFLNFIPWTKERETSALTQMDIGIMPLPNDPWSRGKCGFKLIQYGAAGKPSVASDVGVNPIILENERTGFICQGDNEWTQKLTLLLSNERLRTEMGSAARKKIVNEYSIIAIRDSFLALFES